jgi:hypothetical protein
MDNEIRARLEEIIKRNSINTEPETKATIAETTPATEVKKSSCNEWVKLLMHSRDQAHLWHLQTKSYAEHIALNTYYDAVLLLMDSLLETLISEGGRPEGGFVIELANYSTGAATHHLTELVSTINELRKGLPNRTDVQNICDEIIALANKTKYLLTLK